MGGLDSLKIMLDTNILIYFLEDVEPYASKVEDLLNSFMKRENEGIISTINLAEILTGFYAKRAEEEAIKVKKLLKDLTLNGFRVAPVTFEIADLAASLRAKRKGKLPDALIAATAINQSADLIYSQDEGLQRFADDVKICRLD